jgi:hypothetical protein
MNILTPVKILNHSPTRTVGIILNNNHVLFFLLGDSPAYEAGESHNRTNNNVHNMVK